MTNEVQLPATVDFLPAHYHERTYKKRNDLWRLLLVAVLGGIVVFTALSVHQVRRQADHELATAESMHDNSPATNTRLAWLQSVLQPKQARADLLTYLRYPWPRSQILSGVLASLPSSVTLTRLHIVREPLDASPGSPEPVRAAVKNSTAAKDAQEPTDLQRLHDECDKLKCVVTLTGSVKNPSEFYEYLSTLSSQSLFSRVELGPVERASGDTNEARFSVRLTIRPGYGQPNGPDPKSPHHKQETPSVARVGK